MTTSAFTTEQKQYLEGFAAGSGIAMSLKVLNGSPAGGGASAGASNDPAIAAQDATTARGGKLVPEEQAKRKLNGLDTWDMVVQHAREGKYPKGTDVFMMKFQGLFYVAPAQDSFMCRLRFAGGAMTSAQMKGLAALVDQLAAGHVDVTTRANLQIREIGAKNTVDLLMGLSELGIINRGAGADNIRNVTATATAGIDDRELIDTMPLARRMHHYILNHREMYGLPRKFNIAFDGGGRIAALEDTNDIGFTAVMHQGQVKFRLTLGGITGHKDFARDTGVMLSPEDCIPVAAAIVRAFVDLGDRTDRKKARLKYVLDKLGFEDFLKEVEKHLPAGVSLTRVPLEECDARPQPDRYGHVGFHPQKQAGLFYCGLVLPVGRLTSQQMRGIAKIADEHGNGELRLTVWQNLLITHIPQEKIQIVRQQVEALGLSTSATNVRGALVACTGNAGCKFANANTKKNAMEIANYLEARGIQMDKPVNIHVTGCPNSCAQHYIGDIGLIGVKVPQGEEMVEGYNIVVGGGYGLQKEIGRELFAGVLATDAPVVVEKMLSGYLEHRGEGEEFSAFVRRHSIEQLTGYFERDVVVA